MANLIYQNRSVQANTRESVSQRQSGGKVLQDNRQSTNLNQLMKNAPVQRVSEEEEPLQGKFANQDTAQLEQQPAAKPNHTGLPDNLKSGIESLSGMSMDNVRVHYNSAKPAQLNALAYAQGTDIHVASGQEKHLPHEAWHVVQQAQGRVKPTMQMKEGVPVNDDEGLEREADVMGGRAMQMVSKKKSPKKPKKNGHKSKKHTLPLSTTGKKRTMTVRNHIDDYTSGRINSLSRATGVERGPRNEAQKVASFLGGSWVGGHMINDQLGGNGTFQNIVPITSSMNGKHKKIENQANNLLSSGSGTSLEYKMNIKSRTTVTSGLNTVKNLPLEFKQTLNVYPLGAPSYTVNGSVLKMF